MSKLLTKTIAVIITTFWISFANAADKLPEVMVGQTTVSTQSAIGSLTLPASSDYMQTNNISNPNLGESDFSVMAWVKPNPNLADGNYTIFWCGRRSFENVSSNTTSGWSIGLYKSQGEYRVQWSLYNGIAPSQIALAYSAPIIANDGNWHHIILSVHVSATDGTFSIFWDNSSVASGTILGSLYKASNVINLGDKSGHGLSGYIDEARIYNGVIGNLSTLGGITNITINNEVTSSSLISNAESTSVPSAQLLARWSFNKAGGAVNDDSENGHSGTLMRNANLSGSNITSVSSTYYGGFTGNEVVYNYLKSTGQNNGASTNDLYGFDNSALISCINGLSGIIQPYTACFQSNSSNSGIKTVASRTSVNNSPLLETAVIFYHDKIVIGDVYGGGMKNFAFWGRSLHEQASGTPSTDATWKVGNYPINENAQASWLKQGTSTETDQMATYKSKTNVLANEAKTFASVPVAPIGLQRSDLLQSSSTDQSSSYPEGKVWKYDRGVVGLPNDLNLNTSFTYQGKGTIVVPGNLTIGDGVEITPADSNSRLGIIVEGNVIFGNNVKINAAVFAYGDMGVGNGAYTGSFVAKTFTDNSTSNIRFYYDYALDSAWPPGFRYLNMPHPTGN